MKKLRSINQSINHALFILEIVSRFSETFFASFLNRRENSLSFSAATA